MSILQQNEAHAEPPAVPTVPAPAVVGADPWAGLFQTGLSLLQELASAARPAGGEQQAPARSGLSVVRRDRETGEPYLHLPMPSPDLLDRVLSAAGELLRGLRR